MDHDSRSQGRQAPRRFDLESIICCPTCRGSLQAVSAVRDSDRVIRDGQFYCGACRELRAGVRDYRIDFLRTPPNDACRPGSVVPAEGERRLGAQGAEIGLYGPWTPVGNLMRASGDAEAVMVCEGQFSGASVRFLTSRWSGIVEVRCDDGPPVSIDLFRDHANFTECIPVVRDLAFGHHRLVLRVTGRSNPAAEGRQVFVQEFVLRGPVTAGFDVRPAKNYGNPYSDWILRHLSELPPDALVLEVGGGDRRTANPRHVNLEYLPYELPDCFGDIHSLPFREASFDAICSQAVFEHVRQPFVAASELVRVVRPGGIILTEVAFLQPLHGVPHHYFNMTVDGLKALFGNCTIIDEGWFGDFGQTVSWMADVSGVKGRLPAGMWEDMARLLGAMDERLDDAGRRFIASGVRLAVRSAEAG